MFGDIYNKKQRLRDFFADSASGFLLIWKSGKRLTIINFSLFIIQSIIPLLSLLVLKGLIDELVRSGVSWQRSGTQLLLFTGLQLLSALVTQVSAYQLTVQQQIISDQVASQVLSKAVTLDLQYYENPAFYDELHMAQQQSLSKPAQLIAACQGVVQNLVSMVLLSVFMAMAHWLLLPLVIVLSIPLAISRLLYGYQQFLLDKNCMPMQRKAADLFQYLTSDAYAKEVRLFQFGSRFINQFQHFRNYIFTKKKQLHYKFLKQSMLIQLFEIVVTTIILCIIIGMAATNVITIGGLVIYFQVFQRLQASVAGLFQSGISLFQQQLYLREISRYLSAPSDDDDKPLAAFPEKVTSITVKHLSFTYPQTEREVLHNINMIFRPGQITAIVGENGSGKSTLIKLLCHFYNIPPDTIAIGDTDITALLPEEVRKHITVIFQDFGKYYLTIEDNITLGSTKSDKSRLSGAIDKAGLTEKIKSFPQGSRTYLGRTFRNGEQLSGGQWQKIALARAFYKNSNIIILDEPTSAMDPIAEHTIFENLKKEIGDKIIILVTHRLYNLKLADNIYVMENGRVTESGSFSELMAAQSTFANIYDKQRI